MSDPVTGIRDEQGGKLAAPRVSSMPHVAGTRRRSLQVDGFEIHDRSDCYVIAEVGHNHQGDVEHAKRLIDAANECGVNAVKLQKRSNRMLYTREFYEQTYDN